MSRMTWDERVMPEPNTGCHLWTGTVCKLGYGRISRPGKSPVLVHRVAYERAFGPIPAGMKVCHRCDVPSCVNPDHLFLGTQKDNLRDMFAKGRARPGGKGVEKVEQTITRESILTRTELADALKVSRRSLDAMDLPFFMVGKRVRYIYGQVLDVLAQRATNAA